MRTTLITAGLFILSLNPSQAAAQSSPPAARAVRTVPVEIVETRCPTVIVYQRGVADNFNPGIDPVFPSLALSAFLQNGSAVAYDDVSDCDHWFGDSFKVDACAICCGLCSATLEVTLRGCGSTLDCNDTITIGQAPFNAGGGPGYVIWSGRIDPNACPGGTGTDVPDPNADRSRVGERRPSVTTQTVVKTIQLDPRKIAELVCEKKVSSLDVLIQDDQIVDSMRLILSKP